MYASSCSLDSKADSRESDGCTAGCSRSRLAPLTPAAQKDAYRHAIEAAGLRVEEIRRNPYEFISEQARNASDKYGVKSVSLLAAKS